MSRTPLVPTEGAALYSIDSTGQIETENPFAEFQINPESYQDLKSNTGWIANVIPGQSLPVYQWVAGGPRVITFEALVTKDTSYFNSVSGKTNSDLLSSLAQKATSAVGDIASNFLGVSLPLGQLMGAVNNNKNGDRFDLDISEYLGYYRNLYYPTYGSGQLVSSPPLVYFYCGIDDQTDQLPSTIDKNTEVFIVTNLDIKITKQLPDLTPMEAIVTFQLEQYPITSIGISLDGNTSTTVAGGAAISLGQV